ALCLVLTAGIGLSLTPPPFTAPLKAMPIDPPRTPPPVGKPAEVGKISGRVLGPDGKPFAEAHLSLDGDKPVATSGADGTFSVAVPGGGLPDKLVLVATATGLGPDWVNVSGHGPDVTLQLVKDDVPLHGLINDLQGKPVAGAKVEVLRVTAPAD